MKLIIKYMLLIVMAFVAALSSVSADSVIICASTTSTQNSGLFDHILPLFEQESGIKVKVVAAGTGAALEIGKRGDADMLIVHAKDDELKMVQEGWFVNRHDIMYNDFIIVGPDQDPAGISGMTEADKALGLIFSKNLLFVSRGDNSGTHKKELKLWKAAGVNPKGNDWYLEVGQGMAKTLRIAGEKQAYTLTDRGTYLSLIDKEKLGLEVTLEKDPALFNQYGAMVANPRKHSHVKYDQAMQFINWLISPKGQGVIASFKDGKGNQLFVPNAD